MRRILFCLCVALVIVGCRQKEEIPTSQPTAESLYDAAGGEGYAEIILFKAPQGGISMGFVVTPENSWYSVQFKDGRWQPIPARYSWCYTKSGITIFRCSTRLSKLSKY